MIRKLSTILFLFVPFMLFGSSRPLRVECDIWPPYQQKEGQKVTGYCTEMIEAVFKNMGQKITVIKAYPWKRAIKRLESGQADALFSAGLADERKNFAYYPDEPLFQSNWILWTNTNNKIPLSSYDELKPYSVGVVRGYSYTPEFWTLIKKFNNYEEVYNDELNFKKLNIGRLDYTVAELGNGLDIIRRFNIDNIVPLKDKTIKNDRLYILFNKINVSKQFVDKFSDELKKFKKSAAFKELHKRYFSSPVSQEPTQQHQDKAVNE